MVRRRRGSGELYNGENLDIPKADSGEVYTHALFINDKGDYHFMNIHSESDSVRLQNLVGTLELVKMDAINESSEEG